MSSHSENIGEMYQQAEGNVPPIDMSTSNCMGDAFSAQQANFAPLPPGEPPKPPAPPHPPPQAESQSPQNNFAALDYDQVQPSTSQSSIQLPPPSVEGYQPAQPLRIICKDFQRGNCYRLKCKYNHDLNQFLEVKFCHDFQNRTCTRNICKFIHCTKEDEANFHKTGVLPPHICSQIPNMPACNEFLMKGKCIKPNECSYRHITPEAYNNEKNSSNPPTTHTVTSPSNASTHSPAPVPNAPFPNSTHLPPPKINNVNQQQQQQQRVQSSPYLMTTANPQATQSTSGIASPMNLTSANQLQHHPPNQSMMQSYTPTEPPVSRTARSVFAAPPPPPPQYIPQALPVEIPTDFTKPPPKLNAFPTADAGLSYDLKSPVTNSLNNIANNSTGIYNPIEGSLKRPWSADYSILNNVPNYLPTQAKAEQNDNIKVDGVSQIFNGNNNYGMNEHDRLPRGTEAKKMRLSHEDRELIEKFDERIRRMEESNQKINYLCTNLHFKVECLFAHLTENKLIPRDAYNIYLARITSSQIANQHSNNFWSDLVFNNTNTGISTPNNVQVPSWKDRLEDWIKGGAQGSPVTQQQQNIFQPPVCHAPQPQLQPQPPVDPNHLLQQLMKLFPNGPCN